MITSPVSSACGARGAICPHGLVTCVRAGGPRAERDRGHPLSAERAFRGNARAHCPRIVRTRRVLPRDLFLPPIRLMSRYRAAAGPTARRTSEVALIEPARSSISQIRAGQCDPAGDDLQEKAVSRRAERCSDRPVGWPNAPSRKAGVVFLPFSGRAEADIHVLRPVQKRRKTAVNSAGLCERVFFLKNLRRWVLTVWGVVAINRSNDGGGAAGDEILRSPVWRAAPERGLVDQAPG